ncbi:hypothetical protein ACP4OV_017312 [Aristida adscensionis]
MSNALYICMQKQNTSAQQPNQPDLAEREQHSPWKTRPVDLYTPLAFATMVHVQVNLKCPPTINQYVVNLTSSYTDQRNEPSMVSASVIMFVLVGLFFNLNLFSGISNVSAILDPKVRLFLTSALSLFLPVMSYLFSEAKNTGYLGTMGSAGGAPDLTLRAGIILAWMLLVELLRKKVDEIGMRGYSGTIQRAGRVIWLGNLVFFNIKTAGRKAVFGILWILCATKVVQRIAYTEIGKRSYAHGMNARLMSCYMAKVLKKQGDVEQGSTGQGGQDVLGSCMYIVMGEEELVKEPTADGYDLKNENDDGVVTVSGVWQLEETQMPFTSTDQIQRLKRLGLSFALFKLLRRRFEHLPMMKEKETLVSRELILRGLCNNGESSAEALFQVMSDEVNFLSEYYHSVVPVVLASPFFLFVNYFVINIIVAILCLMTVILCGNGDFSYAFHSLGADNYTLRSGVAKIVLCLLTRIASNPQAFFSIVDISITVFLFIIFFYEEIWEFLVFLLSNWFMVSLLYNFTAKRHTTRINKLTFSWVIWLRSKLMSQPKLTFKQFSVLNLRWPPMLPLFATFSSLVVKKEIVPNNLKRSIMDYLVEHGRGTANYAPLTNGKSALRRNNLFDQLSWACESQSVAEVILTWHIATCILKVRCPPKGNEEAGWRKIAARVSKYCSYLVAFHPELLPDNQEKAELVFQEMMKELKGVLGCLEYYLSWRGMRVEKIIETAGWMEKKVVRNGATLAVSLMDEAKKNHVESVWKVMADVWTELIIYIAPSSDEDQVKGHEQVLVQGGEFITTLWALSFHTGISRPSTEES